MNEYRVPQNKVLRNYFGLKTKHFEGLLRNSWYRSA